MFSYTLFSGEFVFSYTLFSPNNKGSAWFPVFEWSLMTPPQADKDNDHEINFEEFLLWLLSYWWRQISSMDFQTLFLFANWKT